MANTSVVPGSTPYVGWRQITPLSSSSPLTVLDGAVA